MANTQIPHVEVRLCIVFSLLEKTPWMPMTRRLDTDIVATRLHNTQKRHLRLFPIDLIESANAKTSSEG